MIYVIIFWEYQKYLRIGGIHGVMVTIVRNGHSDTSSNPG